MTRWRDRNVVSGRGRHLLRAAGLLVLLVALLPVAWLVVPAQALTRLASVAVLVVLVRLAQRLVDHLHQAAKGDDYVPSQSHRDDLPSYQRSRLLRQIAAAVIGSAGRRSVATPRRPSIRATATLGQREQTTTKDNETTAPRPEPRALPAAPERHYIGIEASAPDPEWEWVHRRPKK